MIFKRLKNVELVVKLSKEQALFEQNKFTMRIIYNSWNVQAFLFLNVLANSYIEYVLVDYNYSLNRNTIRDFSVTHRDILKRMEAFKAIALNN